MNRNEREFLVNILLSSFLKVFGVKDHEYGQPVRLKCNRFSVAPNTKPSWVLTIRKNTSLLGSLDVTRGDDLSQIVTIVSLSIHSSRASVPRQV